MVKNRLTEAAYQAVNDYEQGAESYEAARVAVNMLQDGDEKNFLMERLQAAEEKEPEVLDEISPKRGRGDQHAAHYRDRHETAKGKKAQKAKNASRAKAKGQQLVRFSSEKRKKN